MNQEESDHKNLTKSDKDMEILNHHVRILRTTFDSVQIFVTRHHEDKKETIDANAGGGDWYARYGIVRNWLIANDGYTERNGMGDDKLKDEQ